MDNESKSDTPETDTEHEMAKSCGFPLMVQADFARKLERQRDEAREQARNADLRTTRAKRERDGAWAARERLANAITNAAGVLSSENVQSDAPT